MASIIKPVGSLAAHLSKEEICDLAEINARALLKRLNYQPTDIYHELVRYQQYLDTLVSCLRPAAKLSAVAPGSEQKTTLCVTVHERSSINTQTDWWVIDRHLEPAQALGEAKQVALYRTGQQLPVEMSA